jgi:hypothetical protein
MVACTFRTPALLRLAEPVLIVAAVEALAIGHGQ